MDDPAFLSPVKIAKTGLKNRVITKGRCNIYFRELSLRACEAFSLLENLIEKLHHPICND